MNSFAAIPNFLKKFKIYQHNVSCDLSATPYHAQLPCPRYMRNLYIMVDAIMKQTKIKMSRCYGVFHVPGLVLVHDTGVTDRSLKTLNFQIFKNYFKIKTISQSKGPFNSRIDLDVDYLDWWSKYENTLDENQDCEVDSHNMDINYEDEDEEDEEEENAEANENNLKVKKRKKKTIKKMLSFTKQKKSVKKLKRRIKRKEKSKSTFKLFFK